MLDTIKTDPITATIRRIKEAEDGARVSFDSMNSWYHIPPQLMDVVAQAAEQNRALTVTLSRTSLVTAELQPALRSALSSFVQSKIHALANFARPQKRGAQKTPSFDAKGTQP